MKEDRKPLVLNKIVDLYSHLGVSIDRLNDKSEFFIGNLADFQLASPFVSPLYRANFFSLVFAKDCSGTSFSDHYTFDIRPGSVYFNNPGDIKNVVLKDVKGLYMATLTESFLKQHVHPGIFEEFPFLLAEVVPPKILAPEQFSEFEQLYKQLMKEFEGNSPYRFKVIGHLCVVLLIKIKEYFWNDYNPIEEGSRSSQIVKTFKKILEKHYRNLSKGNADKIFRVQEYAEAMNLHPNYLNTVIKTKTGKPVGSWITDKTISEAKSLLINSDISIKEIACGWALRNLPISVTILKSTLIFPRLYIGKEINYLLLLRILQGMLYPLYLLRFVHQSSLFYN